MLALRAPEGIQTPNRPAIWAQNDQCLGHKSIGCLQHQFGGGADDLAGAVEASRIALGHSAGGGVRVGGQRDIALDRVEQGRRRNRIPVLGEALGDRADVLVDAENSCSTTTLLRGTPLGRRVRPDRE